jgi:transposase-like protein
VEDGPRFGIDYPGDWKQFHAQFPNEKACRRYLEKIRWRDGFVCPSCGAKKGAWRMSDGWRRCKACRREVSVTSGTIFEGTRSDLRLWFEVMWRVTSSKAGISANTLYRELGFGSYETAWAWLHKLRRAMVRPDRDKLSGDVEVDETYVGGVEAGVTGRETYTKSIVVVAAEMLPRKAYGRIRLRRISGPKTAELIGFIKDNVEPGSVIHTDAWNAYRTLPKHGYTHKITNMSKTKAPAHEVFPRVHRVASLLKRWLLSTHQGAVGRAQLDYYLDEFTFRHNRRTSKKRGLLFYRLVEQAVQTKPAPYKTLIRLGEKAV